METIKYVDRVRVNGSNRENFFHSSEAVWVSCKHPTRLADYTSKSGSQYWYMPDGVIRFANHWDCVASCTWQLDEGRDPNKIAAAFCRWADFTRTVYVIRTAEAKRVYKNGNALLKNGQRVRVMTNEADCVAAGFIYEEDM